MDLNTIQVHLRLYRDALECGSACNATGVAISLGRVAENLRTIVRQEGGDDSTDGVNRHPIMLCYVLTLASLAGVPIPHTEEMTHRVVRMEARIAELERFETEVLYERRAMCPPSP